MCNCWTGCFGLCEKWRLRAQPNTQAPGDIALQPISTAQYASPAPPVYAFAPDGGHASTAVPAAGPGLTEGQALAPATAEEPVPFSVRFETHRAIGALRQQWIDNPNDPGNTVQPLSFQIQDLTHGNKHPGKWKVTKDSEGKAPLLFQAEFQEIGLPNVAWTLIMKNKPPKSMWKNLDFDPDNIEGPFNSQHNAVAEGVIIAIGVKRSSGPHWSEIALAQYISHYDIHTLRYVFIENVINKDTKELVESIYASKLGLPEHKIIDKIPRDERTVWEFGTPEYQAILGTTFGKAVAALVLAGFPNGGYRIARIRTWKDSLMQIRFDILPKEEVPDASGIAIAPPAPPPPGPVGGYEEMDVSPVDSMDPMNLE